MAEPPPEVTALRAAVDELDHALLELVAKRRALVGRIFDDKRRLGLPLFDPSREAALIAERRAFAERLGVPAALSEEIFRTILKDSHTRG